MNWILEDLQSKGAVLLGGHFVYTSGMHGTAYINMRAVAHAAEWLQELSRGMADRLLGDDVDVVLGPETLGRTLAGYVAANLSVDCIWCDFVRVADGKQAVFSPKLNFGSLVDGRYVAVVDDLLTTGSSLKLAADLVRASGGIPDVGIVAVRRTPDVVAEDTGVDKLEVMADVPGFVTYTPKQCAERGPCSRRVPMVLRPGHGHEWIRGNPDYPVA